MSQDDIRKFLVQYRNDTPIGMLEMANEIGICMQTLICFLKGGNAKIKTWERLNVYVENIIDTEK